MAHDCVDWTATPPVRKTPLLVLSRGDDHVYIAIPEDLQALERVARKEFDLGDDVNVHFLSRCASLCHGQPARITEHAWAHLSPFIGCATVVVSDPRSTARQAHQEQPTASEATYEQRGTTGKRKARPKEEDEEPENERALDDRPGATAGEAVKQEKDVATDHGSDRVGAAAPEADDQPWDEEVSAFQRPRNRRRVAPENDDEADESEREHKVPAMSPPKPSKEIKERQDDHQPELQPGETHGRSTRGYTGEPIKQGRSESGSGTQSSHAESLYGTQTQTQTQALVESGENHKVMIRITHRPSEQESKFTAKATTKVAKVVSGACRSFGLDVSQASLYLIVPVTSEDGDEENLFPCDKGDTIVRAGASHDIESRFLLKMAGEA